MAVHYRTQGIILKKQDVREADRVFTVFTKDFGKLKLWAISERKITSKLRGGLELFYCSEIEFIQGKTRKTITDVMPLNRHVVLRGDLERLRLVQRFCEIADELIEGQEPDERIWRLLLETLSLLNRPVLKKQEMQVLAYYFLWNLLAATGYTPSFQQIAAQDVRIAEFIASLLGREGESLKYFNFQGINKSLLQTISQEHLSRVLEN